MPNFTGTLNSNEVFAALFNMIIAQTVLADNIANTHGTLADKSRVEGGLYGDTKLFYSTDVLRSYEWKGDLEAPNLLELFRPEAPECQAIVINKFRYIPLTVDFYLSKRAWGNEGAFSQFNSQMLSWIRTTKRIYDATMFNSFIGTNASTVATSQQNLSINLPAEPTDATEANIEAYNRNVAQSIALYMADLLVNLEDVSRDYNDYGNLRSFDPSSLMFVWNSEWVNKIKKLDLPTIFHNDKLVDKFAENVLPARYFGNVNTSAGTAPASNTSIRSLIEKDYNTVKPNQTGYNAALHIFPGDLVPAGQAYNANETYTVDPTIAFKIYHKDSVPFMTAFSTGSEFYNPRALVQTHFLIWGYNQLEHLKNYPFITVKASPAE